MERYDNSMARQVRSLPELLRQQYGDLALKTRIVLTNSEIASIQKIILTGCGDSHAAAIAMRYIFEELTGIPTEVVPAIELSQFYSKKRIGFAPNNPLVIAISNSGSVARIGEAAKFVVKHGGFVLGITGNEGSLLGKSSSRILKLNIPPFESAPGVRSYLVSLLSLLLLAIRFGEVRGCYTMDQAQAYREDIVLQSKMLERVLPQIDEQMMSLVVRWKEMEAFDFVGAGMDYATAFYGQAKIFEAVGKYAMCVNTEEWLHLNFFMKNVDKIATIVVCSKDSAAKARTQELLKYAVENMGRPTLLLTDVGADFSAGVVDVIEMPTTQYSITSSLTRFVPLALLAGYCGAVLQEKSGRGCVGPWSFAEGGAGVKQSRIIVR